MSGRKGGFPVINLLIVIGILGFTAAGILAAVDPVRRLEKERDAKRWSEVNSILRAILQKQESDRVNYTGESSAKIIPDDTYAQVIVSDDTAIDCTDVNQRPGCDQAVSATAGKGCVANLGVSAAGKLVPDYIAEIPVEPRDPRQPPACSSASTCAFKGNLFYGDRNSGYYIHKFTSGRVEIGACKPERASAVSVSR